MTRRPPRMTEPPAERTFRPSAACVFAFGVLLPVITLLVEVFTRMSAGGFFDPIPTPWHALLIAVVPLANLVVLLATTRPTLRHRPFLGWLNAVAIGVSLCYTLLFLPFTPIGVIGIIFFGLGFLPLSPLLSFVAALIARAYLREYARPQEAERVPHFWTGLGTAALLLSLASAQMFLTD